MAFISEKPAILARHRHYLIASTSVLFAAIYIAFSSSPPSGYVICFHRVLRKTVTQRAEPRIKLDAPAKIASWIIPFPSFRIKMFFSPIYLPWETPIFGRNFLYVCRIKLQYYSWVIESLRFRSFSGFASREGKSLQRFYWKPTGNILLVKQISYISILNGQLNGDGRFTDALILVSSKLARTETPATCMNKNTVQ